MTTQKFVYSFGDGNSEGDASMKNLLGGKGANLAEMSKMGLPVPPGFTITTEFCDFYYKNDKSIPEQLKKDVSGAINFIESKKFRRWGGLGFLIKKGSELFS